MAARGKLIWFAISSDLGMIAFVTSRYGSSDEASMAKNDDIQEHGEDLVHLMDDLGPATSATVVPDDSHVTIRQNRSVTIHFEGSVTVDVIEPPVVFDAEIKQAINRALMAALASVKLGAASNITVLTHSSSPDGQHRHDG